MDSLKIMEIEIEKLNVENNQHKNDLKIANDQCNVYKNIIDKINQPYAYLVQNLQDKGLEVLKLNKLLNFLMSWIPFVFILTGNKYY